MQTNFGRNVRRIRRSRELTQGELASKAGICKNTVLRIEKSSSDIKFAHAIAVAKALGTTIDELLK